MDTHRSILRPEALIPLSAADLPTVGRGNTSRVYHLNVAPENVANSILLVGDPGRAIEGGKKFFDPIEFEDTHRGLHTLTGLDRETRRRCSYVTTGIGTSSVEVVFTELWALKNINLETRHPHQNVDPWTAIRVGTCGALRPDTKLDVPIITLYAIGLDNTGLPYSVPAQDDVCEQIRTKVDLLLKAKMEESYISKPSRLALDSLNS